MDILKDLDGASFMIPHLSRFSSQEMHDSLRMSILQGGDIIRDFIIEEEYVDMPIGPIDIFQDLILDFYQTQQIKTISENLPFKKLL